MIDDVRYTLSSTGNKYSLNKPVDFKLTLKNPSVSKKEFKITEDKFLVCTIKSKFPKKPKKVIVNASDIINKDNFSILPGEERVFYFSIKLDDEIALNNEYLYVKINLYFLEHQFRRNSLTIYLER